MDITVSELKQQIDTQTTSLLIDVREPHEWDRDHLPQVEKISQGDIPSSLSKLEAYREKEIVLICRSGRRSDNITNYLKANGFPYARNLAGGMLAWKKEIDSSFDIS